MTTVKSTIVLSIILLNYVANLKSKLSIRKLKFVKRKPRINSVYQVGATVITTCLYFSNVFEIDMPSSFSLWSIRLIELNDLLSSKSTFRISQIFHRIFFGIALS